MAIIETYKGPNLELGLNVKKVIVFDMDGVLFDSTKLIGEFFMQTYPTMTKEDLDKIFHGNFHEELEKFKLTNNPIVETPEEHQIRATAYSDKKLQSPLYDGIQQMLERLHTAGHTLVVNTSAIERNCKPLFEYSDTLKYFDFFATAEVSKSKVEKFQIISDKYNVPKNKMIFVTDTLGDLREADSAGVPTIAVTWGAHTPQHFTSEEHKNLIKVVASVEELESLL